MKIGGLLLLIALPACCILLPLVTAGTLAAIGGWFADGPGLALVAAVGAGIITYLLWRRRGRSAALPTVAPGREAADSE
ncbi:MAG: hypothetical protein QGI52_07870 [Alphaproteobacteria bacterium]|nr:hypothetical protein [Alphaproteobacteria bacterium]